MSRFIAPVLIALAVFGAWMHWAVLDPANVGWLLDGEDRGQSMIGLAAYLRAGGPWPSLHQPLLSAPEGMTLLFTDSIPLLGLLLKPLAPLLPAGLQLVGPWYLACLILHAGFAWLLVRRHASEPLAAWAGTALLTLMPALLDRYGHASLCAQWLILWELWIFLERPRSAGWWAAVLGVAALVHSYLLLMVAAIWASALLRSLVAEPDRLRTVLKSAATLIVPVAILWLEGALGGPYLSTGTYGRFTLALDAWWNPSNPAFSALLPSPPQGGGQAFEGLNYLGAGLLATVLVGLVSTARNGETRRVLAPLLWLLPALALLLVVAIGPLLISRGETLASVTLPQRLVDLLDPVRASGRLAWPATYVLAIATVIAVAGRRRAVLLLGGALALQVIDLAPMLAAVRATSARATDRAVFHRTRDPRWAALVASAAAVDIQPPSARVNLDVMEEVAWRAVAACRPVRYAYAARESAATHARIANDYIAFRFGQIDPTRLYVLLDGYAPVAAASRVRWLDGIAIIPPSAPAPPPSCSSSPRSAS